MVNENYVLNGKSVQNLRDDYNHHYHHYYELKYVIVNCFASVIPLLMGKNMMAFVLFLVFLGFIIWILEGRIFLFHFRYHLPNSSFQFPKVSPPHLTAKICLGSHMGGKNLSVLSSFRIHN